MFNVNNILGAINSGDGFAKPSHFAVRITPPTKLINNIANDLIFFCEESALPGVGVGSDEVRRKGYGLVEQRPTGQIFEDLPCSFICDSEGNIQQFFIDWMKLIFNFDFKSQDKITGEIESESFGYPDDYVAPNFEIIQYKSNGEEILTYSLDRAYPKNVGSLAVSWSNNDSYLTLPISITFRSWVISKSNILPQGLNPNVNTLFKDGRIPSNILNSPTAIAQSIFKGLHIA